MLNRMYHVWLDIRASFWFLPTLIVLTSVLLAFALIELEEYTSASFLDSWPRAFAASVDGSRSLLSTIATTTITVTGVVFSSTLVALSLASSQYSSRILRNFMADRGTQTSLGVFLGIFAYCLIVLRTISGGENQFVPSVAVLTGLMLGFLGIAILIYFIHHLARSIQANHILAEVASETICAVAALYPELSAQVKPESDIELELQGTERFWHPVAATKSGYLQSLDVNNLVAFAAKKGGVIRAQQKVGEFAVSGVGILSVHGFLPNKEEAEKIANMCAIGRQRTVEQDVTFGLRQLVDVALRALSPGVNDTTTATMCIDQLTAVFVALNKRDIESAFRCEQGQVRLVLAGPNYADLFATGFDQIRQNAAGNVWILKHLLSAFRIIARDTSAHERRTVVLTHVLAVTEVVEETITLTRDKDILLAFAKETQNAVESIEH
ncbi:DUF2254 domain-containing protein [Aliidiomarina shirensis]|nr:DUF2254 domain-containing protein [Aliidiomarina shirensis]